MALRKKLDVKAKYVLLKIRMLDVQTGLQRLGDVAKGAKMACRACRSFCKSRGSEGHFVGLMAVLHPLPNGGNIVNITPIIRFREYFCCVT